MIRFCDIESKLPMWLTDRLYDLTKWRGIDWARAGTAGSDSMPQGDGRVPAGSLPVTEVFDSHLNYCNVKTCPSDECWHIPILDIDIPAALLDSSTAGHHHLYINRAVRWREYKELLRLLAKMGIIEENYASVSLARGGTSLRAPWIRKGKESQDVVEAVNDFLAKESHTTLRPTAFL